MGGTSRHQGDVCVGSQGRKPPQNLGKREKKKKRGKKARKKPTQQINKSIPNKLEMSYYIRDHKIEPRKVQVARTCC